MATLNDVKILAAELGITFKDSSQAFDLDSKVDAPLCYQGTFRKGPSGINGAYESLVRHQANLRSVYQVSTRQDNHRRGIGASGALGLFFLAALVTYAIGTFYPETRVIAGPLTILFMLLIVVSAVMLARGHTRK